ncbi:MAG: DUF2384 domain-containing protein [Nibricoccus sp.]
MDKSEKQSTPRKSAPQPTDDVLSGLPGIVAATASLHRADGCLDAARIQELFGLRALPADHELPWLERIARLLVFNPDPDNFRKWLRLPNSELSENTPIGLIECGRAELIANFVEDILTNRGG